MADLMEELDGPDMEEQVEIILRCAAPTPPSFTPHFPFPPKPPLCRSHPWENAIYTSFQQDDEEAAASEQTQNPIESLQENGIGAADIKKLKEAGYYTIEAVSH
jgi:hypothetical protein